jgi:hypothetical protein
MLFAANGSLNFEKKYLIRLKLLLQPLRFVYRVQLPLNGSKIVDVMRPACATRCLFAHRLPTPQFYRLDPWIDSPLEGRLIVEFSSENVLIGSDWLGVETTMRALCNLHPMQLPMSGTKTAKA